MRDLETRAALVGSVLLLLAALAMFAVYGPRRADLPAEAVVSCKDVWSCLSAQLVPYVPAEQERMYKALYQCAGGSPDAVFAHRSCFPYALGRDPQNGLMVDAHVTCSDLCPSQTRVRLRYRELDNFQCLCAGGAAESDPGRGHYVGCAARDPAVPPLGARFRASGGSLVDDAWYRMRGPLFQRLSLSLERHRIWANGHEVVDAIGLAELAQGLSQNTVHVLSYTFGRLKRGRYGEEKMWNTVYVSHLELDALVTLIEHELMLLDPVPEPEPRKPIRSLAIDYAAEPRDIWIFGATGDDARRDTGISRIEGAMAGLAEQALHARGPIASSEVCAMHSHAPARVVLETAESVLEVVLVHDVGPP